MTTQEFLTQLEASPFSEATKAEARSLIGTAAEITPEIKQQVLDCLQREVEEELKDIAIDPAEAATLEAQLDESLKAIEQEAADDQIHVEQEVRELSELSQKIDVLERLHS